MKTKMTVNGVSVCPTGEERHEYFTLSLPIRLPAYGRRIILLHRPDIGGVPIKTGYMAE